MRPRTGSAIDAPPDFVLRTAATAHRPKYDRATPKRQARCNI